MTNIILSTIQIKRGTFANMPTLLDGELYHAYDQKAYYIGQGGVNQLFSKEFDTLYPMLSRIGISSNNKLTIDDIEQVGGTGTGVLVFNTLTDLQNAYPNGANQPAWITSESSWYYWDGVITQPDTTPPNEVTNLAASNVASTTLTLSWTASTSSDIASYDVYQGATLLGNTTQNTYNVSGLTASTQYSFTVKAKDATGNISTGVSVTPTTTATPDTTAPNDVTNLAVGTITATTIPITWTLSNSSDVANYEVAYSSNGGASYTVASGVINSSSTSYTVTGLTASTAYIIRVVAIDGAANRSTGVTVNASTIAVADTTPPTITASPVGGTYSSTQLITLSSNETATIYYTTDGSTPTYPVSGTTQTYSNPISISATSTLKYIGRDTAGNVSTVQTQTYTINTLVTIVSDIFNRVDSSTSLGNADTGQTWLSIASGSGISGNQAYPLGTNAGSVIDALKGDVDIKAKLPVVPTGSTVHNLIARYVDSNNHYMIQNNGTIITLYKKVAGTYTQIGSAASYTTLVNDIFEVSLVGSTITVLMSGVQKGQWTDTTYDNTKTQHGFLGGTTACRFDDFSIAG